MIDFGFSYFQIKLILVVGGYRGGEGAGSGTMADGRWLRWWQVVTEVVGDYRSRE